MDVLGKESGRKSENSLTIQEICFCTKPQPAVSHFDVCHTDTRHIRSMSEECCMPRFYFFYQETNTKRLTGLIYDLILFRVVFVATSYKQLSSEKQEENPIQAEGPGMEDLQISQSDGALCLTAVCLFNFYYYQIPLLFCFYGHKEMRQAETRTK